MKTVPLPADWKQFLNQVQQDLGHLLEQAQAREGAQPPLASPEASSCPLAETMRRIHDGMDERLLQLDRNLNDLDQHLAQVESEAQHLQQSAQAKKGDADRCFGCRGLIE